MKKKSFILIAVVAIVAVMLFVLVGCGDKGYELSKKTYDNVIAATDGTCFIADEDGLLYLFNQKGKKVFKQGYEELKFVSNGYLLAKNSGDFGYTFLTTDGKNIMGSESDTRIIDVKFSTEFNTTVGIDSIVSVTNAGSLATIKTVSASGLEKDYLYFTNSSSSPINVMGADVVPNVVETREVVDNTVVTTTKLESVAVVKYGFQTDDGVITRHDVQNITIYAADGSTIHKADSQSGKTLVLIDDYLEYNRFVYYYQDKTTYETTAYIAPRTASGSRIEVKGEQPGIFVGENKGYILIDDNNGNTLVINNDTDETTSVAGPAAQIGKFLAVYNEQTGKCTYYNENLSVVLSNTVLDEENGLYVADDGKVYDGNLNYIDENVEAIYGGEVKGVMYAVVLKVENYDSSNYKIYKDGTYTNAHYDGRLTPNAIANGISFRDNTGSSDAYYVYSFVKGKQTISTSMSGDNYPVTVFDDLYYTQKDGDVRIYRGSSSSTSFDRSATTRYSVSGMPAVTYYGKGNVMKVAKITVTKTVDSDNEIKTSNIVLYYANIGGGDTFLLYDGGNGLEFSQNGKYVVVSTEKPTDYNEKSKDSFTVIYTIEYAYDKDGNITVASYTEKKIDNLSDATIMGDYLVVTPSYTDKQAIYNLDGKMLVSAKYYVDKIAGNLAKVHFSDNDLYGIIELTKKGYKVKEDVKKYDVELFNGFYWYKEVAKDGIAYTTIKTSDGKKIADKITTFEGIQYVSGNVVENGKATAAVRIDQGKGWKVLFIKIDMKDAEELSRLL